MVDAPSNPPSAPKPRRWSIFGSALLLVALAVVVIYTSRGSFFSPLTLVVVAAIGLGALLLQLRLRPDSATRVRAPLWLNVLGLVCAIAAVCADVLHFREGFLLVAALGAVVCFGVSGVAVLRALGKQKR